VPSPPHEVAGREQVDAGDLELGRGHRAGVAADAEVGQVVGAHLGLLEQRRDQAVGDAAVADAFADRVDARVVGLQRVVDHDAAVAVMPADSASACSGGCRRPSPPGRPGICMPSLKRTAQRGRIRRRSAAPRSAFEQELQALALRATSAASRRRRGRAGAPCSQSAEVHHGHVHAAQLQAVGRLQAEQAAADHHRVLVLAGGFDHRVGVGDVAVADHAGQVVAGDRQDEGRRAGGQQQAVVVGLGAVARRSPCAHAVDLHHLLAGAA
jgi:hypothetical protein